MTQLIEARKGLITSDMAKVAETEGIDPARLMDLIASGKVVLPKNKLRSFEPVGIGEGLKTKVNANIGTSPHHTDLDDELQKLKIATEAGADAVMDLSTGGDLDYIRKKIIEKSTIPLGTVPLYQAVHDKDIADLDPETFFDVIRKHGESGVDFITVHCGVTLDLLPSITQNDRLMGIVSRGGSLLASWMNMHGEENPLYAQYDRLLDLALEYDMTLSLGDGLRPGSVCDATDKLQLDELHTLAKLSLKAFERGVQCMIEGPGHVPLDEVAFNIMIQKKMCNNAPFYVLGPLTTDIAPGYDHITSAIGGAAAAAAGADFLCYVTPGEHLRLPTLDDVRQGVIAARIAAHSGDMAKGLKNAMDKDRAMSIARKNLDWNTMFDLAIDPALAKEYRGDSDSGTDKECSMCGRFCAININNEYLSNKTTENARKQGR